MHFNNFKCTGPTQTLADYNNQFPKTSKTSQYSPA